MVYYIITSVHDSSFLVYVMGFIISIINITLFPILSVDTAKMLSRFSQYLFFSVNLILYSIPVFLNYSTLHFVVTCEYSFTVISSLSFSGTNL